MSAAAAQSLADGAIGVACIAMITLIVLGVIGALPWQNRRERR